MTPIAKSKSFRGIVKKDTRTLKIINRDKMAEFLESLEGEVDITISEVTSRTHFQNNYYWKVVVKVFGDELGYTREEMHEVLKNEFKIESTSKLDRDEFRDYLDKIIRWASIHFQILIPDPNQDED